MTLMTLPPAPTLSPTPPPGRLRGTDCLVLVLTCAALFGAGAFSGRPLSVHEARVPQLAREMVRGQSNWLLPQSGGRPWLERPPLPHWFTAASMILFRRTDSLWVARLPAAVAGCAIVLAGAWMAARWFGGGFGLLCGAVLATTYELYQYATLAEDDIYLGAVAVTCVAMFVKTEWTRPGTRDPCAAPADAPGGAPGGAPGEAQGSPAQDGPAALGFLGPRPWPTVLFFTLLGLTNLAKGPLVGAMPIAGAVGAYLFWNRDRRRVRHYTWLWGWLIFLALTAAWPWWAKRHYPDVVDNWRFDYLGHAEGARPGADAAAKKWNEPPWFYLTMLPMALAPWSWAVVIGLVTTARRAWREPGSPERFLWCWAWVGVAVLSVPARKHHHYLVPVVTPWATLGALGLLPVARRLARAAGRPSGDQAWRALLLFGLPGAVALALLRNKLPGGAASAAALAGTWVCCVWLCGRGLARGRPAWVFAAAVAGFIGVASWVQFVVAGRDPVTLAEQKFLREVEAEVPDGAPLMVNADMGSLRFFGVQFNLHRDARLLHNLSFLRGDDVPFPAVYVVTQAKDQDLLERLGAVRLITRAATHRPRESSGQALALYEVTMSPGLRRYPRPRYVDVMQAMGRRKGPWCGDDWPTAAR